MLATIFFQHSILKFMLCEIQHSIILCSYLNKESKQEQRNGEIRGTNDNSNERVPREWEEHVSYCHAAPPRPQRHPRLPTLLSRPPALPPRTRHRHPRPPRGYRVHAR